MDAPGRAEKYVISLDQGTSSSRAILWTSACRPTLTSQEKVTTTYPQPGWVEQDPEELWNVSIRCIQNLFEEAEKQGISLGPHNVTGIGITNQRETTIAWNKQTGKPLHNAIIWLDTRTKGIVETMINEVGQNHYRPQTGLPLSPYFSGTKMKWLIDNCKEVKDAITADVCLFGTVDSWLIWKLTGGPKGGVHVTDVTNASRTLLLNLKTLTYDDDLLKAFSVPRNLLPEIKSSAEIYGKFNPSDISHNAIAKLNGVPIAGCLGDQQAALLGQLCIEPGQAKCTYGTGCFLLYNTGSKPVESPSGLLTTVGYQLGPKEQTVYALEGSMAIAGAGLDWIKNLGFITHASEIDGLAGSVKSTEGVYFIPAFSGLFAPHWKAEAKGIICGLTQATTKAHISLALLQSIAFGVVELMECAQQDSKLRIVKVCALPELL